MEVVETDEGIKLTWHEYVRMLEAQLCSCAICQKPLTPETGVVDHCHKTGKIGGVLCDTCNAGVGMLGDCPVATANATVYLLRRMAA